MKKAWQKIESWIKNNHPVMFSTLNAGATTQELIELESAIGINLPEDFKTFLSIHNGQIWTHLNLFNGDRLSSNEDIIRDWKNWKEAMPEIDAMVIEMFDKNASKARSSPAKGIKDDWWNPAWIPITADGSGDSFCIDLDPTSEGTNGQIIRMYHDDPSRELIAPSFRSWIETYTTDLENGVYVPSDDIGWGGIIKQE